MIKTYLKPFCDFCEKSNDEVDVMIAASENKIHICNECVDLCVKIIEDRKKEKTDEV